MKAPTGGIILVDSIHIRMSLVRLVGEKAIAQAAGTATIRPRIVEPKAMITELAKWRK